jgi:hypothetical protein
MALLGGIVAPILWLGLIVGGDVYRPDLDAVFSLIAGVLTTVFLLLMIWEDNPVQAERLWERPATGCLVGLAAAVDDAGDGMAKSAGRKTSGTTAGFDRWVVERGTGLPRACLD